MITTKNDINKLFNILRQTINCSNRSIIVTIVTHTCVKVHAMLSKASLLFRGAKLRIFRGIGHFAAMWPSQVTYYTSALVDSYFLFKGRNLIFLTSGYVRRTTSPIVIVNSSTSKT